MEAFKIKNGLSAKRYLGSTTTLSGSTIDLSLGSMFSTTLSSDPAYTFTNPPASGNAQAFSVEVTGGNTNFTNDSFATTLYTGNESTQTITNGIDLAGDGGVVWIKRRNLGERHAVFDSERSLDSVLATNEDSQPRIRSGWMSSFNADGFTLNTGDTELNNNGDTYVSWTFKKQAKFFDIVTYTGDGTNGRAISHNLGSTPGCIIIKCTAGDSRPWAVYHRGTDATSPQNYYLQLNETSARISDFYRFSNTAPTDAAFTVASSNDTNGNGNTYVAYVFGHNTASDGLIQCGSYTGTAASQSINIGWKPQWLLIKSTGAADWYILDTTRGWTSTSLTNKMLNPNNDTAESTVGNVVYDIAHSNTGFDLAATASQFNASGQTYIYMAIRGDAAIDSAITWPSSVKWPAGVAPTTPAPGTKDLFTFLTTDGGTTYYGKKAAEGLA